MKPGDFQLSAGIWHPYQHTFRTILLVCPQKSGSAPLNQIQNFLSSHGSLVKHSPYWNLGPLGSNTVPQGLQNRDVPLGLWLIQKRSIYTCLSSTIEHCSVIAIGFSYIVFHLLCPLPNINCHLSGESSQEQREIKYSILTLIGWLSNRWFICCYYCHCPIVF